MQGELPVPWWTFWLAAAFVLYLGMIWFFVREATRSRRTSSQAESEEPYREHEPDARASATDATEE